MSRLRRWAFTSYKLDIFDKEFKDCRYIIMGKEICPKTKKEHIQGYVEFNEPYRMNRVKKFLGDNTTHLEGTKGTREQNIKYCSKDGNFKEFKGSGTVEQEQKKSVNSIQFVQDNIHKGSWVILNQDPAYYKFFMENKDLVKKSMEEKKQYKYMKKWLSKFVPNLYQVDWLNHLEKQGKRKISWVYDEKGGSGKSMFARWLVYCGAILFTTSKTADITYAYNGQKIIIFDFSRSLEEHLNYGVIESLKNGMVFSSKYKSGMKVFKPPKIIVLANFPPVMNKMSLDRWDLIVV